MGYIEQFHDVDELLQEVVYVLLIVSPAVQSGFEEKQNVTILSNETSEVLDLEFDNALHEAVVDLGRENIKTGGRAVEKSPSVVLNRDRGCAF